MRVKNNEKALKKEVRNKVKEGIIQLLDCSLPSLFSLSLSFCHVVSQRDVCRTLLLKTHDQVIPGK